MNLQELKQNLKQSDESRVRFAIVDIDGVLRGKLIHKDKILDALEHQLGFCDVVFGWDMVDTAYDNATVTGWHTGYPDAKATVAPETFRTIPWEEDIPFILGDFSGIDHPACPRTLLKKIIKQGENLGYEAKFAQEFEWFNFKETPDSLREKGGQNLQPMTPGMFGYSIVRASQSSEYYHDLFNLLEQFGVPLEGLHTETGPGVYEAAIRHTHTLEAADRAVLFKTGVKEIASRYGIIASFMAKWNAALPGCSGHLHQSLWQGDRNVFFDDGKPNKISSLLESYIAGQLHCLPHILPLYAPTINSYKRLVEGAWAPTTLTWGIENRTTALRVITGQEHHTRLETRVPGSDTNPYLAMAAALASGLYGIHKKLKLKSAPTKGNGYADTSNGRLPPSLEAATEQMKQSELARELLGDGFVDHFVRTREWECRQYASAVTDWELKRYFEII